MANTGPCHYVAKTLVNTQNTNFKNLRRRRYWISQYHSITVQWVFAQKAGQSSDRRMKTKYGMTNKQEDIRIVFLYHNYGM